VFLAASTHPGEEEAVADAHVRARERFSGLLTIIAPRHPARGDEVARLLLHRGLGIVQRSAGTLPDRQTDVYIMDTIGEMGLAYRLADLTFVGGTLNDAGGHNPIEAAKLGSAILHGPGVHNAREIYAALDHAGGARVVSDGAMLADEVLRLLLEKDALERMARAAASTVDALSGAIGRTLDALDPLIAQAMIERSSALDSAP
jgi:3-deoxy-D-manno-octulosonic-acid transferase